ncbi:MAG: pyridoxal kinase, partial [Pseudomonadota bacterium]
MEDTLAAAKSLGPETVLVTSAIDFEPGTTGSILAANGEDLVCKHPSVQNAPNGPGDLMSGLFLAHHMRCENNRAAFRFAMSAVYQMVLKSKARGSDELTLAQDAACLLKPGDQLKVSRL